MASPATTLNHSFAEYVALEEYSNVRHEYRDGAILAMAGGSPEHAALIAAITGLLMQGVLGTRCAVHSSDLRIRVRATGLATYPDASIVCAPRELDPQDRNTVLNPRVLVEVTSPSSEAYDCGDKREHYLKIESLEAYVVVSHKQRRIDLWHRASETWAHDILLPGSRLKLDAFRANLDVDVIYDIAAQAS